MALPAVEPRKEPRTLACARCGTDLICTSGTGKPCWCGQESFALPLPLPEGVGPYGDCLCPDCLREVAGELRALGHGPDNG